VSAQSCATRSILLLSVSRRAQQSVDFAAKDREAAVEDIPDQLAARS
jgi:hypothetical protein